MTKIKKAFMQMLENLRAAMVPAQISRLPENACARKVNEKPFLANIPVKVPLKMLQQKKSRCDCVVNITSVKDGLRLLPRKNIETINNLTVLYIYIKTGAKCTAMVRRGHCWCSFLD